MAGVPGNTPIPGPLSVAQVIEVTSTNLFSVAALYLGDATQWNRIAALNGMVDPWIIAGVKTLILPPYNENAGNGGILEAPTSLPTSESAAPAEVFANPSVAVTWSWLQTFYTGQLFLNGGVVMALSGFFPITPPAAGGIPWSNGGQLQLSSLSPSANSPLWVYDLPTSGEGLTPGSGFVFTNGLVVEVI